MVRLSAFYASDTPGYTISEVKSRTHDLIIEMSFKSQQLKFPGLSTGSGYDAGPTVAKLDRA